MRKILGISAFYHDSAAALLIDGRIVAAAQEERFSRRKHDPSFPANAVDYVLRAGQITMADLDQLVFYDRPGLKFQRLVSTYLTYAPRGLESFLASMPVWLGQKIFIERNLRQGMKGGYSGPISFVEHHRSHAASAFFPSPFREAAVLTVDGVGEWATTSFGMGRENRLELLGELRFPHSLGLLYSAFTLYCGFRVNSGEYKLMGLAPYGRPRFSQKILDQMVDLRSDGSLALDMRFFNYCEGLSMISPAFEEFLGQPARSPEDPLSSHYMDVAASIQQVTEEAMLRMGRHVHRITGAESLCLAGGVALNCVANGRLLREGPFKKIWIQPAAGDSGGALGAALDYWHTTEGNPRRVTEEDQQQGSLLGPSYTTPEIRAILRAQEIPFHEITDPASLCHQVAGILASEKVVGWFQGRMEFGPRALGSRSILGDPRSPRMQTTMNLKIKFRESFRPFAPSVLREFAQDYFELPAGSESPYMLLTTKVKTEKCFPQSSQSATIEGLEKLREIRSVIPAVTHVDYSARVQTVDAARNGRYYQLLKAFYELTQCPVLINTSFNVRGEPIVATPQQAIDCFLATDMDALVLEDCLVLKSEIPPEKIPSREGYIRQFAPD